MNQLFRLKKYITYQWRSKTKYYLHSPFVFQFYLNVLEDTDRKPEALNSLELLRGSYRSSGDTVQVQDMGAGSSSTRHIADIESKVAIRPRYGRLLHRLVKYLQPSSILELGTSIGLSSSYMAIGNPAAMVISLEGSAQLAAIAADTYTNAQVKNVQVITGNFDDTLAGALQQLPSPGLIFFDGNHRKDATLRYFEQCLPYTTEDTVLVFDDIYWSPEMYDAWQLIQQHPQVTLSIDVFQLGICFFHKGKVKESFMLRY